MDIVEMRKIAIATANAQGISPALVQAVCHHESGGWRTWASRYEPRFFDRYVAVHRMPKVQTFGLCSPDTERTLRATSFGLMQIMGQTAREFGFEGEFLTQLCDPHAGIEFGCRKLARCLKLKPDVSEALLMYNGGGDPSYPGKVLAHLKEYS